MRDYNEGPLEAGTMAQRLIPRYFVTRPDADTITSSEEIPPAHVIDSFFTGGRHLVDREWIVTTDCLGNLRAVPDEARNAFPESLQAELAWHEVSGGNRKRLLEVTEFFLFYMQLLEQPTETPGLNDPVYLYGTIYGPYPDAGMMRSSGIEGQLTITRADLLEGLLQGAGYAFHCAKPGGEGGPELRCFHLPLPADREEEIERGRGVVITYPLLPPELILDEASNETVVSRLLYDILTALKEDFVRENINHPLRSMMLPVPSRFMLGQQLQSNGYEIEGNQATKKTQAGSGFQGFLASVFGSLMSEVLELPPEGKVDDFLRIAAATLNNFPGWPSRRALALRNRLKSAPPDAYRNAARRQAPPPQIKIPVSSAASPAPLQPRVQEQMIASTSEPQEWMKDFINAHQKPGSASPRLTSTAAMSRSSASKRREPEWMKDFSQTGTTKPSEDPPESSPAIKEDWMKDFE